MSSLYSIGQMNEYADALERNGWTPADLKKASGGNILAHLLPLVRAYGETPISTVQHIIDCDADPFVPSGWTVESHKKGGQFAFNPAKIRFHLSSNQQGGKYTRGNELRKELANEPVLNANVLDYLLKNPHLIPDEWKKDASGNTRYIFFWGTIYRRSSSGDLCVRCLYFRDGRWRWRCSWLGRVWYGFGPAAVLAS